MQLNRRNNNGNNVQLNNDYDDENFFVVFVVVFFGIYHHNTVHNGNDDYYADNDDDDDSYDCGDFLNVRNLDVVVVDDYNTKKTMDKINRNFLLLYFRNVNGFHHRCYQCCCHGNNVSTNTVPIEIDDIIIRHYNYWIVVAVDVVGVVVVVDTRDI